MLDKVPTTQLQPQFSLSPILPSLLFIFFFIFSFYPLFIFCCSFIHLFVCLEQNISLCCPDWKDPLPRPRVAGTVLLRLDRSLCHEFEGGPGYLVNPRSN